MHRLNAILGDAFYLYSKYFKEVLILTSFQVGGALLLLILFIYGWTGIHALNGMPVLNALNSIDPGLADTQKRFWYPQLVAFVYIIIVLFYFLELISMSWFVMYINHKEQHSKPDNKEIFRKIYARLPVLFIISLITLVIYGFTSTRFFPLNLIAVVIAIFISQAYFFALLEDHKFIDAFKQSKKITKGSRAPLLFFWLVPIGFSPPVLGYAIWRWLTKEKK